MNCRRIQYKFIIKFIFIRCDWLLTVKLNEWLLIDWEKRKNLWSIDDFIKKGFSVFFVYFFLFCFVMDPWINLLHFNKVFHSLFTMFAVIEYRWKTIVNHFLYTKRKKKIPQMEMIESLLIHTHTHTNTLILSIDRSMG